MAGFFQKQWEVNFHDRIRTGNLLINIQNTAMTVAKQLGLETVRFVLAEYGGGATSIEALHPCYYESVFNALFDYEAGMKD